MSRDLTPSQKWSTAAFSGSLALLLLMALLGVIAALVSGCGPVRPPQPHTPPPPPTPRVIVATVRTPGGAIVREGAATLSDDFHHILPCVWGGDRLTCTPAELIAPGWQAYLRIAVAGLEPYEQRIPALPAAAITDLGEIHLSPTDPPLLDKTTLIRTAQENFGSIKLAGCGLHRDNVFDPFLLERWLHDRPCFERMMAEHARRNDNMVTLDPASGYGGFNAADLWHDPATFTAFVRDVRRHRNARGEPIRVRVFVGGDAHFPDMRLPGAWDHWVRDLRALAAVSAPYVDAVVPCWECRHNTAMAGVSARLFYDMLREMGQQFPRAVHAVHLVAGSSAPSSWPCDPLTTAGCTIDPYDADDPARGNEPGAWAYMLDQGLVDEFLYQFDFGGEWMYAASYPSNPEAAPALDTRGALSRYWDIVVRLGDDPWSVATACATPGYCGRRGWRQVPVVAWEAIYDRYWDRDPATVTEAYQNEMCRKALALGGWHCGFASVRR